MAKIDLSNFRVVKFFDRDIERNYINDILHAIVDRTDALQAEVDTLTAASGSFDAGALRKVANLSDVVDAGESRDNLGLGSLAIVNDAPSDGTTYGRKDGAWEAVSGGGGSDEGPGASFTNGSLALSGTLTIEGSVPYSGTITGWTIVGDAAGDVDIIVYHSTYAAYPTMSTLFTASCNAEQKNTDSGLSHAIAAGDILRFSASNFSLFTRVTITLLVEP